MNSTDLEATLARHVQYLRLREGTETDGPARRADFSNTACALVFDERVLDYASFEGADLRGSSFDRCDLRRADFTSANLANVSLRGADVRRSDFVGALLRRACFADGVASGARFDEADLQDANLTFLDLQGASFRGANLRGALLDRAYLGGADFAHAALAGARIHGGEVVMTLAVGTIGSRADTARAWVVSQDGRNTLLWDVGCQRGITTEQLESRIASWHGANEHGRAYRWLIKSVEEHPRVAELLGEQAATKKGPRRPKASKISA